MFAVSAFAMSVVYLGLNKTGTVAEIAVQSSYWLLFGITLLFVFGVTIQDIVALRQGYGLNSVIKGKLETPDDSNVQPKSNMAGVTPESSSTGS